MNSSLHVEDSFIKKTVLLECINEWYQVQHMLNHTLTVLLEYIDRLLQFSLIYNFLLCLTLSMAHYAQNYAGIIGGSLLVAVLYHIINCKFTEIAIT